MIWKLMGYDTFAAELYAINGEYNSKAAAIGAGKKQLEKLEKRQPTSSSGGQSGIQDAVFALNPAGELRRVAL